MTPPQITATMDSLGRETCRCTVPDGRVLSTTHKVDALRILCRMLVAEGLSGPAEVRDENSNPSLTLGDIAISAKYALVESETKHLGRVIYRPFDPEKLAVLASRPRT